ncbi:MAG: TonB-dependent receptor [bacterium]|nr:TonB-dependent receptor [bacterium]
MRFRRSLPALLVLLAAIGLASAQGNGRIEGRIVKEGDGVGGVAILVAELKLVEISDAEGKFVFTKVPAGTYTLILTLGENSKTQPAVGVLEGRAREVEIEVDWALGKQETITVTAAAARAAKIVDAPAAVTSVPEEKIEAEAAHGQLPKVLEFTPGAEITQGGLYDFNFNTRGFNSSLNRRVSTYIDGRDVSVVLLGAQEWASITTLDDMAGLEFVRGPSAALYGANASAGVINITTKPPRGSEGQMFRVTAGELDTLNFDYRHAAEAGRGWYWKVIAGARQSADFSESRVLGGDEREYAPLCDPDDPDQHPIFAANCLPSEKELFIDDDNEIYFTSGRVDKYFADDSVLTIEGGTTGIRGPLFQTGIGRVQVLDATKPWGRLAWSNGKWNVAANYTHRKGNQANMSDELIVGFELITNTKRYGLEAQGNWSFFGDRMRLVVGAGLTEERVDSENRATGEQTVVWEPLSTDRQAIFSQLDYKLNEHIKFVFAGRVDRASLHETQFSPKAAMVYSINPKHSFRFTFNKAFQVANYSEFFLHARLTETPQPAALAGILCGTFGIDCGVEGPTPVIAGGVDDLNLEKTTAFELGYSGLVGRRVFFTVDYYRSKNKDFITDLVRRVQCDPVNLGDPRECFDAPLLNPNRYYEWGLDPVYGFADDHPANTTYIGDITVAQALRNSVRSGGWALSHDLDGSPVIVAFTYNNAGEVETQGVDFSMQYFFNEHWNLQASYSWFDYDIVDEATLEDFQPNTPEFKGSMSLSYSRKNFHGSLSGRWVDDFEWAAGVCAGPVPSYSTVDLAANYNVADWVSVGMNVSNLSDKEHYQTWCGDLIERRALTNVTFHW